MLIKNTILEYPVLKLMSIGKGSFEAMGKIINRSGDTIRRMLMPISDSYTVMQNIAHDLFAHKQKLLLIFDDTLIKKVFSRKMVGAGYFFDTKIGRRVMAYKLLIAAISDGKYVIPLRCTLLFAKELLEIPMESKDAMVIGMVQIIFKLFPNKRFIIVADGAFATKNFLRWCVTNKVACEVRMHSNRKVEYKEKSVAIRNITELRPKGKQTARTIQVTWHSIPLEITAHRRIDKHGIESVVFQAATYSVKPATHVRNYTYRWGVEKMIRTSKQTLSLQNCFSTNMDTQLNHFGAALLAFALAQTEMWRRHLKTPEAAIRALDRKKFNFLKQHFGRYLALNPHVHA